MASTIVDNASSGTRGRKRRNLSENKGKKFVCTTDGCGRSFTRSEHLQRHLLNHSTGEYTCARCRAHFKRRDLLERHMSRHRQKDEEAGAEGCGVLNTRKRMWKDAERKIVTKKPNLPNEGQSAQSLSQPQSEDLLQSSLEFLAFPTHQGFPISPPTSNNASLSQSVDNSDSGIGIKCLSTNQNSNSSSGSSSYSPTDQRFWSIDNTQPSIDPFVSAGFDIAPFDEIFTPDTASSFNAPFTTMSNYNWLFHMDWARNDETQQPIIEDPLSGFSFGNNTVPRPSHALDFQLEHMNVDVSLSTVGHFSSLASQPNELLLHHSPIAPMITPPTDEADQLASSGISPFNAKTTSANRTLNTAESAIDSDAVLTVERPLSLLQPSRNLPVINELTRQQLLNLVDIIKPISPDGSIVTRDHSLLSLSCLQTYCDLFFTHFNTTYPLIHMSTFDASEADTLLLASLLLLGATYGQKDAHQLAVSKRTPSNSDSGSLNQVCIHDVLRPQIFANAGFSAKPDLWLLQTILLVECFGKSRAGQKQHDMSHLFHGLLINLIRRSDCQSIRPPTPEEATDHLEDDWRIWCEAEQKKRLAFLCFMWDTQHAVLFCQSLCMSAFELRSNMPCDQAIWEADSAEAWHQLRQKQPTTLLFLSCLKMYLHPNAATISKKLNVLSQSLLLHGLMSVAWDMQRRDQTSLGVIESNPLGKWQTRLAASYSAWHADFTAFCTTYLSSLPSSTDTLAKEFHVSRAATLALYHSAHILLHTPFLDLQIYAGARHILGRSVARHDYVRSQLVVKKWVAENIEETGKAVWHAAALVSEGVDILDCELNSSGAGGGRLWHHPWAVYLGTLVIWGVGHARPTPLPPSGEQFSHHLQHLDNEDELLWDPVAEMKTLLDAVLTIQPEKLHEAGNEGIVASGMGKRGTNGLAAVVSKCLSKVRWAVVHDGTMVLRGLVQWRLVGGGGGLGGL